MKFRRFIISFIAFACTLFILTTLAYAASSVKYINGGGPIGDSIAISQEGWSRSDSVVIANVEQYPDAMCGAGLAYLKDAPILLTYGDRVDSSIIAEIKRLNARNVYLFGGTGVLNENVELSLKSQGLNVYRIWGMDRFKTAVNAGEALREIKPSDTVFIAYANNFPDALSAANYSAAFGYPVLYTDTAQLNNDTENALEGWSVKKAYILGGLGVISQDVENKIKSMGIDTVRLGGQDRYETALEILKYFGVSNSSGLTYVTGNSHQDALAGAVFAAKMNAPVMIYDEQYVSQSVKSYLNSIGINKVKYIIGNYDTQISAVDIDRNKTYRSNNGGFDYFQADIEGNTINIEGKTISGNKWAMLTIEKMDIKLEDNQYTISSQGIVDNEVLVDDEGNYHGSLDLADVSDGCILNIYMSGVEYGTYNSVYYGIPLTLEGSNGVVFKSNSDIYNTNMRFQETAGNSDPSAGIMTVKNAKIKEFALQLTNGINNTWDKVKIIHDWIAANIYYDLDTYYGRANNNGVYDGDSVFSSKLAVCQGYADLFQMMLNSVGIPSRMVSGKAIQYYESWDNVDQNVSDHAWNEVYIDGRWVLIDATWDSGNKYEYGKYEKGDTIYTYFDPTIEAFSMSHKDIDFINQ